MAEQLGLGEIIKNFLGIGQEDTEPSGAPTSSLRPKARPEGLMASTVKPKIRPEDDDDDDKPTDPIAATTNTITMMNNYDDSEDEDQGVELDSASLQELLINPNSLYDKHSTTVRRLSRFGNEVPKVMQQKLKSPVVNDLLVDVTAMLAKEQSASKPPEPEMSVDPIPEEPVKLNNKQIQQKLVDAGYNIKVDGIIGPQTKKAIKAFQKEKGLKVDGIVGKNTTAALAGVPEITSETLGKAVIPEQKTQMELLSERSGLMSPVVTDKPVEIVEAGFLSGIRNTFRDLFDYYASAEGQAKTLLAAAPLAEKILPINAAKFAEFLGNDGQITLTSEDLTRKDYNYLRKKAIEVIERGDDKFDYPDWGFEEKSVLVQDLTKTAWGSLKDPAFRMATLIGQTAPGNVRIENGRVVVEDVYDFNTGPLGRKLQKAFELKDKGDEEGYEKLSSEALKNRGHLEQLRIWAAALGVPQGEGTRFLLDLGEAP